MLPTGGYEAEVSTHFVCDTSFITQQCQNVQESEYFVCTDFITVFR